MQNLYICYSQFIRNIMEIHSAFLHSPYLNVMSINCGILLVINKTFSFNFCLKFWIEHKVWCWRLLICSLQNDSAHLLIHFFMHIFIHCRSASFLIKSFKESCWYSTEYHTTCYYIIFLEFRVQIALS